MFADSMSQAPQDGLCARELPAITRTDAPDPQNRDHAVAEPQLDGRTRAWFPTSRTRHASRRSSLGHDLARHLRGSCPASASTCERRDHGARHAGLPDRMAVGWTLRRTVVSGVLRARTIRCSTQFTDVIGGHYSRHTELTAPMNATRQAVRRGAHRVNLWLDPRAPALRTAPGRRWTTATRSRPDRRGVLQDSLNGG